MRRLGRFDITGEGLAAILGFESGARIEVIMQGEPGNPLDSDCFRMLVQGPGLPECPEGGAIEFVDLPIEERLRQRTLI